MSSSRSQTPSPRISPLPRLESYASYSSTPDRLWEGHDPVRLAAREASIRARMVARARARVSEGSEKGGGNEGGSEVLTDQYGRLEADRGSIGRTTPILPTTPTPRSPLKPLILASSATLPACSELQPPSPSAIPQSTSTPGRRPITRRPSAVELKYSPISSPQTPVSISFVTQQQKERLSTSPRISISPANRMSDAWSYRSSGYLSPSPSSFSTHSPRIPRSPVSPNLLSPSIRSSTSPTSTSFRSLTRPAIPPTSPDLWDDEEQWKRVSTYLVDPYGPATDASPVDTFRPLAPIGKAERDVERGRRALGVTDLRSVFDLDDEGEEIWSEIGQGASRGEKRETDKVSRSPHHLARTMHLGTTSPTTVIDQGRSTSTSSPRGSDHKDANPSSKTRTPQRSPSLDPPPVWNILPPLPVEPPKKAALLQRMRSRGGRNSGNGLNALGITEVAVEPETTSSTEDGARGETSANLTPTNTVRRRDLPIMAKMSIMEERLRRIGQRWTGNTSKSEGSPTQPRIASPIVNMNAVGSGNISRLSSISSLAGVATGAALDAFPTPPIRAARTPWSDSRSPKDTASLVESLNTTDHACDRRPSASSTITIVSDSEPTSPAKKDKAATNPDAAKSLDSAPGLQLSPSEATTCLGSPRSSKNNSPVHQHLPTSLHVDRNNVSDTIPVADEQDDSRNGDLRSDHRRPAEQHQDQASQKLTSQDDGIVASGTHRASSEWLVPPTDDIAAWGELEIIGRSR